MLCRSLVVGMLMVVGLFVTVGNAESTATLSVEAIDFGNFRSTGYHLSSDLNYMAGRSDDNGTDRSFFLFDLTTIQGEVLSAKLRAWNPGDGFNPVCPVKTYALYDVSSANLPRLTTSWGENDNTGKGVFDDLGQGSNYGSTSVSPANNAKWVEISLQPTAVAAMNSALDPGQSSKLFAIGGAITQFTVLYSYPEFVFANTDPPPFSPQLVVTFQTPEPGMAVHLGTLGLLGLVVGWRRWRAAGVRWRRGR